MPAGVISFSFAASGSARSCVNTLIWAWMNRCACVGDRGGHVRVGVAGGVDGDAGGEVEVLLRRRRW